MRNKSARPLSGWTQSKLRQQARNVTAARRRRHAALMTEHAAWKWHQFGGVLDKIADFFRF